MKQKNGVAGFISIILALVVMCLGSVAFAQVSTLDDSVPLPDENMPKAVLVATVNVGDAKAEKGDGDEWKISFGLSNRIGVQSGVKYGIELRSVEENILADQVIYPESLFLGENETIRKEIFYTAPDYLNGKFKFWIVAKNENGLPFGEATTGEIALAGNEKYLKIDPDKCTLKISGDEKLFRPAQGVDISSDENMTVRCEMQNLFDSEITVVSHFKTTFRTAFGKTISEEDGQTIQFSQGEKKDVILAIPKAKSPQAYDTKISFLDSARKSVASPVIVHYVLRGTSATIQNVTLDKDYYATGETALVSFYWSGRADFFPESRDKASLDEKTLLKIATTGLDGAECAGLVQKEFEPEKQGSIETFQIPLTGDCANGKMTVSLSNEKGDVLDEKTIEFKKEGISQEKKRKYTLLIYWIAIGALLFGVVAILVAKKRKTNAIGMLFVFVLAGMLLGGESAKADTFSATLPAGGSVDYTANLDRLARDYCQGNDVTATGSAVFSACSNTANSTNMSVYFPSGDEGHIFWSICNNTGSGSKTFVFNNPYGVTESPGSFNAQFIGRVFIGSSCGENPSYSNINQKSYNIPFTVTAITNATCGSANGVATPTAPTTNLCGAGETASAVTASGSNWVWTCSSSVTCRLSASCSAPNSATCLGTRCDDTAVTRNVGESVCGSDDKFWTCGSNGNWIPTGTSCPCLVPTVTKGCSGFNSVANITLGAVSGASSYQVRVDTNSSAADGFWYKNVGSLSNDVPTGLVSTSGFPAPPSSFSPTVTYYTSAKYYNSSGGYLGIESPEKSFVAQSCYQCTDPQPVGTLPTTLCSGDSDNLLANTPKTIASSCTDPTKCEYQCDTAGGFQYYSACASNGGQPCCEVPTDCGPVKAPTECNPPCLEKDGDASTRTVYYWERGDDNMSCNEASYPENCTTIRCPNVYREVTP